MVTLNRTLTFFLPNYGDGGLERMFVNLASEISQRGITVYFIVGDRNKPYLNDLPTSVKLISLSHASSAGRVKELSTHICEAAPDAIMTARELGLPIALKAKRACRSQTRIYYRAVTNILASLSHRHLLKRIVGTLKLRQLRRWYWEVDGIIAVSHGVANDVHRISGIPVDHIHVAHNPVVTPSMLQIAESVPDHPWYAVGQPPVILGVGRFTRQKNFELLIKAFAEVRKSRKVRLIILGNGARKEEFVELAKKLNIAEDVAFPGFNPNPYAYLSHSAMFVLSSNWEGSPNVLTEALAVGCPVVATDCPSGPRETLQDGKFGILVPMDDALAMADAIRQTLDHPLPRHTLQNAVTPFHVSASADEYLSAMGFM